MANYSQGAQVEHSKFGLGTVLSSSDERITIKFDDHGEKKFVTNMVSASLKKSDRQPPAEKKRAARKKAAETMARIDVVIEVLDARGAPVASRTLEIRDSNVEWRRPARDMRQLDQLWQDNRAPWKIW